MQQNSLQVQIKLDLTKGFKWKKLQNSTFLKICIPLYNVTFQFNASNEKSTVLAYIYMHANSVLPWKTRMYWLNLSFINNKTMQDKGRLRYEISSLWAGKWVKREEEGGLGVGNPLAFREAIIIGAALDNRTHTRMQKSAPHTNTNFTSVHS